MSALDPTTIELSDPELITRVRSGDVDAFGSLFAHHRDAALRLARMIAGPADADDLVSEAFVKVLNVLLAGGGPDVAFRAYLLTAVRRLHIDRIRSTQRVLPTDDMEAHDPGVPFTDTAVDAFESEAAARAFTSLPERWQMVLWHLEVENQKPADIAPLLGMSANSVSALAYRAREGLRQAFLTMHAGDLVDDECEQTRDLLGGYVRNALSRRDRATVQAHLDECRPCMAVYLELVQVNSSLAALIAPVVLGGAAAAYLAGGAAAGSGVVAVALAGLDRAKDAVVNNLAVAGAAAAGLVAVAVAGAVALTGGPAETPRAEAPRAGTEATQPAPPASSPSVEQAPPAKPKPKPRPSPRPAPAEAVLPVASPTLPPPIPQATPRASTKPQPKPPRATAKPKPSPSPKPPSPTTPPPSSPPPVVTADVSVTLNLGPDQHGRYQLDVTVSGVPAGKQVQLTVDASHGSLDSLGSPGCSSHGNSLECTVGPGRTTLTLEAQTRHDTEIRADVDPPAGVVDPAPGNNHASVTTRGR